MNEKYPKISITEGQNETELKTIQYMYSNPD